MHLQRLILLLAVPISLSYYCSVSHAGDAPPCPHLPLEYAEFSYGACVGFWNCELGDIDNDGDLDAVLPGIYNGMSGINGIFAVYRNRGDGTFESPSGHFMQHNPHSALLADIDDDADLDVIVTNMGGDAVLIYENPGDGVFGEPSAVYNFPQDPNGDPPVYVTPLYSALGDLDADGDLDIAVSDAQGSVRLLMNNGVGLFEFGAVYPILDSQLYDIVAEDFTGDGLLDLAVLRVITEPLPGGGILWTGHGRLVVFANDGKGEFEAPRSYVTGFWPTLALAAADLDGDGDVDIGGVNNTNANPEPNGMWILFNDGLGHFGELTIYQVGPWPTDVQFGDLDRDGDLDAVVTNERFANAPPPHDISILLNRGDGTFEEERRVIVGFKPKASALGDLDNDGDLDIAIAQFACYGQPSSLSVLTNLCDYPFIVHGENGVPFQSSAYSGYIDPRAESSDGSNSDLGLDRVTFRFSEHVYSPNSHDDPSVSDFLVTQTGGTPPNILSVDATDNPVIEVQLDRRITWQEWTTIRANVRDQHGHPALDLGNLGPSGIEPDRIDIGFLPGDVDQSGHVNPLDLLRFKQLVNGVVIPEIGALEDFVDMDRSHAITPIDLLRFKQLINGISPATRAWAGATANHPQP